MKNFAIVDDDTSFLTMLSEFFGNHTCLCHQHPEKFLSKIKKYPDFFYLLIIDQIMPKIDGVNIIKVVRKTSNAPIIMMSSTSQEDRLIEELNAGADDYVIKSLNLPALEARAMSLLRRANDINSSYRFVKVNSFTIDRQKMTIKDNVGKSKK